MPVLANMFAAGQTSLGTDADDSGFRGRNLLDGERYRDLDRKQAYAACTQHDHKKYAWDGRIISRGRTGMGATQPLLGEKSSTYVPLSQRRPSTPYRLAKVMVAAFTGLLFGDKRFPELKCPGDSGSQDYAQALSRVGELPKAMIQARNQGGACGTACLSWCFMRGKPRYSTHHAKNIFVHEWEDREQHMPRHVTECFQYAEEEWDSRKQQLVKRHYWYRRDWTPTADVIFLREEVVAGRAPRWTPDLARTVVHKDNLCHFVWIQNLPTDDIDGEADYEGLYEDFDELDVIVSVIFRGAKLNLDPTLVLKMDRAKLAALGLKKGSDDALIVDPQGGDAKYLELAGTSIEAGLKIVNAARAQILEVGQCVIPDPDKVAAGSVASVSLKVVYAQMTGKTDILRDQYGPGIRRLTEGPLAIARHARSAVVMTIDPETGEERQERPEILLPPKVTKKKCVDDKGDITEDTKVEELEPGEAEEVEPEWGPYFKPTADEVQKEVTTFTAAAGGPGTAIMSTETATELAMRSLGRDPDDELARMQKQRNAQQAQQGEMMSGMLGAAHQAMGGAMGTPSDGSAQVTHTLPLPGGGRIQHKTLPPQPSESSSESQPSESEDAPGTGMAIPPGGWMGIVTVNEARVQIGLPALDDPDGHLTVASYNAKYAKPVATAANAFLGKIGATSGTPPPPVVAPHPPGAPGAPPGAAPPKPPGGAPAPPGGPPAPPPAGPPVPPKPGGGMPPGA